MISPLIRQQYCNAGTELRRNLIWRYSSIGSLAPRTMPFEQQAPLGAHTAAQRYGHVAAVYLLWQRVVTNAHLPELFCRLAMDAEGNRPSSCTNCVRLY